MSLTIQQCAAVVDRLNADPIMLALLNRPDPVCPDSATLAGLGVPYTLAGVPVPAPAPAAVAVLSLIGSPLLEDAETVDAMDCWRALWAVTATPAALSPLYGLDAQIEAIRSNSERLAIKPEDAVALMGQATQHAYAAVDRAAVEMSANYPGASAQDVADMVRAMLRDVASAWGRLPRGRADDTDPHQAGHASMATGSQMWRTARLWLACTLRLMTCGRFPRHGSAYRPPPG